MLFCFFMEENMNNRQLLDDILLSENVCQKFHETYKNNLEFKYWLKNLLPEIEDCFMPQNNPWHIYSVLDHILHSVEEINKQTVNLDTKIRKRLAYTMFLHDIGKPKCHLTRFKNGELIDSFFNHNIASEKIAKRFLEALYVDPSESRIIQKLVNKHDIFMFLTLDKTNNPYHKMLTNKVIADEIKDLNAVGDGTQLLKQLIMVGRADSKSQNPKMTQNSLKLLSKMNEMLNNYENTQN